MNDYQITVSMEIKEAMEIVDFHITNISEVDRFRFSIEVAKMIQAQHHFKSKLLRDDLKTGKKVLK